MRSIQVRIVAEYRKLSSGVYCTFIIRCHNWREKDGAFQFSSLFMEPPLLFFLVGVDIYPVNNQTFQDFYDCLIL